MVGKTVFGFCPTLGLARGLEDLSVAGPCAFDAATLERAADRFPADLLAKAQPPASKPG